jgi:hypothetical protein
MVFLNPEPTTSSVSRLPKITYATLGYLLCCRSGTVENAKDIYAVHFIEVLDGQLQGRLHDRDTGIL